jgi:NhaA family Na+:H+ antiporter
MKFLSPFQKFVRIESFSGVLLFVATIIALIWANSSLSGSYESLWNYKIGISSPGFSLSKPLLLWINDGLMAVFFFLIGLEIKREFLIGELNTLKKMAFPIAGALGGITVPVLFFFIFNRVSEASNGWGIPMATDIAFSLAILRLLGDRVPLSLKIFLTAFAIIDDLIAVVVIALFYSGGIDVNLILYAGIGLALLYFLSYKGIYSKYLLLVLGVVIWYFFLKSGIHPTIAGVLLAFSVPVRQRITTSKFLDKLKEIISKIEQATVYQKPILSKEQIEQIDELEDWTCQYQSPLQHLEHRLHDWVAYFIIPLFALANSGVRVSSGEPVEMQLVLVISICLVLGNGLGMSTMVLSGKWLRIIQLPKDIKTSHIIGISFIAGVGFTMAIFIASLAFAGNDLLVSSAKIGILIGSFTSALIGYLILRFAR